MKLKKHRTKTRSTSPSPPLRPSLRLSPFAWAKLLYFRDRGNTEIGGFGVSAPHDPLLVVDIVTAKQRCTPVTVAFDDSAVADLFDDLVDEGLHPERFGRIWIHSHPGNCPLPSSIDEETFGRVFGRTDWSVMAIVARNDATYARLSFHVGPGGALEIPVNVDFTPPFDASDSPAWEQEYLDHVIVETLLPLPSVACGSEVFHDDSRDDLWDRESFDDGFTTAGSL